MNPLFLHKIYIVILENFHNKRRLVQSFDFIEEFYFCPQILAYLKLW